MADRRSSATKSAGQAPSTTTTSKQKAAGAVATQQANKGLSQKDLALKYGGKYQEGDTVYQVEAPRGRNLSITLHESLGFSDKATYDRNRNENKPVGINYKRNVGQGGPISQEQAAIQKAEQGDPSSGIKTKVYPTKQDGLNARGGRDLSIELEEGLGFGDKEEKPRGAVSPYGGGLTGGISLLSGGGDSVFAKKGKLKEEPFTANTFFDNIRKAFSQEGIESSKQTLIGFGESAKNFGISVIQENIKNFNPGVVRTFGTGDKAFDKKVGKAYIVDPELKKSYIGLEEAKIKGTFQEKFWKGKFSEIDLSDPKTRGNIAFDVSTLAGPGGGTKTAIKGAGMAAVSAEKKAVSSLSNYLKSVGDTFGLEKIGGKTEIQTKVIKPGGGMEFTERRKVQVSTGKGTYISSGGTQDAAQPLRVLEAGQFEKGPKGKNLFKNPVEEIIPSGDKSPTYSPSKANIRGNLSLKEQELLGVGKQGKKEFIYSSLEPTTPGQREFYKGGITGGTIKEIGKSITLPLKDILDPKKLSQYFNPSYKKGKTLVPREGYEKDILKNIAPYENPKSTGKRDYSQFQEGSWKVSKYVKEKGIPAFGETIQPKDKIPGVYSETKAERPYSPYEPKPFKKGTPFPKFGPETERIGAGGPGKAKGFSKDQIQILKESVIAKTLQKQAKEDMDILFKGPRFEPGGFVSPYEQEQKQKQYLDFGKPPKQEKINLTKQKDQFGGIEDFINAKVFSQQKSSNEGILRFNDFITTKLIPGKQKQKEELKGILGFKDDFSYLVTRKPKQDQPEALKFWDKFDYKLTPGQELGPPPYDPPPPPPTPPELVPRLKPPPPIAYFPPLSLSSYGFGPPEGTKTVYSAYGLSEDINIKVLPTYSRYGTTNAVFKAQIKEDKRIQKLFYGGTKTRKAKSKKAKSKRRGKKR